jgi:multiple antibiotic resistance protein
MKNVEKKKHSKVLAREMLFALGFMFLFNFIGEWIFSVLNISETSVKISSGLILFIIALQILFPTLNNIRQNLPKGEPFLIPLAIPLIASPPLLATIMLFAREENSHLVMIGAITLAWLGTYAVLLSSNLLFRLIGENGLMACEKLMGMILVLLAVQGFLDGIKQFLSTGAVV